MSETSGNADRQLSLFALGGRLVPTPERNAEVTPAPLRPDVDEINAALASAAEEELPE